MGEYLSKPDRNKHTETGEAEKVRWVASGMQGWRRSMEDAHIANTSLGNGVSFFGVFDGHGGQEVALYVKKYFVKELMKLQSFKSKCYKEALEECFYKMDEMMQTDAGQKQLQSITKQNGSGDDFYAQDGGKSFAGCTATTILMTPTEIICANAGDSRTVMSKGGSAVELSKDHKPDDQEESRRIYNAKGFVEDGRVNGMLALSRALGDFEYKNNHLCKPKDQAVTACPDIKTVPITSDTEFVVLACDGIWDVMTSQEVITYIHQNVYNNKFGQVKRGMKDLANGCEKCMDDCCATDLSTSQGLGCDNMTFILVELNH